MRGGDSVSYNLSQLYNNQGTSSKGGRRRMRGGAQFLRGVPTPLVEGNASKPIGSTSIKPPGVQGGSRRRTMRGGQSSPEYVQSSLNDYANGNYKGGRWIETQQ
jgi:hypothetical protein